MDVELIMRVAGVGMIVAVVCQILTKTGKDEQATMVSVAGIVVTLLMLVGELGRLFDSIKEIFGL
jgi:stage III sporulation protein AC